MTWPLPSPAEISSRASGVFEERLSAKTGETVNARDPNSVTGAAADITGMSAFDLYLYQKRLANELMPDTAEDWLARHAAIWGVPRVPAKYATGVVTFAGDAGTAIPVGLVLTFGSVQWETASAATIPAGSTSVPVPVQALATGTTGNVAAGTALDISTPLAGLSTQTATVGSDGITGGTAIEAIDTWRARLLKRIRTPGMGGSESDYETWVHDVYPSAIVSVIPAWVGKGSVGVVIAMPGPRAPTSAELATIDAYLQQARPVTAQVITLAATLHAVDVTLALNPDTTAIRAAATSALQLFFSQAGTIGGTVYMSRLDDAVSDASGEYSHERSAPTADITLGALEIASLGTVAWA